MKRRNCARRCHTVARMCVLFAILGTASQAMAQDAEPGIKVGEAAPTFTLKNQKGEDVSLKKLLEEKPTALVFHRSADW